MAELITEKMINHNDVSTTDYIDVDTLAVKESSQSKGASNDRSTIPGAGGSSPVHDDLMIAVVSTASTASTAIAAINENHDIPELVIGNVEKKVVELAKDVETLNKVGAKLDPPAVPSHSRSQSYR